MYTSVIKVCLIFACLSRISYFIRSVSDPSEYWDVTGLCVSVSKTQRTPFRISFVNPDAHNKNKLMIGSDIVVIDRPPGQDHGENWRLWFLSDGGPLRTYCVNFDGEVKGSMTLDALTYKSCIVRLGDGSTSRGELRTLKGSSSKSARGEVWELV